MQVLPFDPFHIEREIRDSPKTQHFLRIFRARRRSAGGPRLAQRGEPRAAAQAVFTGKLGFSLMDSFVNGPNVGEATEEHPLPSTPLPAREVEVLQMLASGMSNK